MNSFARYLGNTFETVEVLKSTGQSFVALVYDKMAQRLCVMKWRSLHLLEIYRTLKDLNEPHVPEIYRLFEQDGGLIVVEEHIDGQTLDEILTYQTLAVDEKFALEILKQICTCLAVIHKAAIVHRDIKPSNIMLTKGHVVKLIDFGIARIFKPESRADTEILGTRGYASPEQFGLFDCGQTDARSDIYSLGVTIKQLLGEDYRGRLLKILNRCTALDPSRRYQSVAEILNAIDRGRKLRILKKFFTLGIIFISVILIPAAATELQPPAENPAESVMLADEQIKISALEPADKVAAPKQATNFPQIDYSPPITPQLEPPAVETKPLPAPVTPEKKIVKPRESVDGLDLYLYLNGNLTGTDGSHVVDISGWQSWIRRDNGVIFPADWNCRLHIENHGAEDLIAPLITVSVGKEKFSVQKSTVKVGQSLDVNIPLAEKFAAPLNGVGTLKIILQAQGRQPLYLNRTFKLNG